MVFAQSVSTAQLVLQSVPEHAYAPHDVEGCTQLPELQEPTAVAEPAVQLAAPHEVELPG